MHNLRLTKPDSCKSLEPKLHILGFGSNGLDVEPISRGTNLFNDAISDLRRVAHPAAPPTRQTSVAAQASARREFVPALSFGALQSVVLIRRAALDTRCAFRRGWYGQRWSADRSGSIQCASFQNARAWRAHALQHRRRRAIDRVVRSEPRRLHYPARIPLTTPTRFSELCGPSKSSIAFSRSLDQRTLRSTTMLNTSSRDKAFLLSIACSTPGSRVSVSASSSSP